MLYHVKVLASDKECPELEDVFDGIYINTNAEVLMLYQTSFNEEGKRQIERFAIPLMIVERFEVEPR